MEALFRDFGQAQLSGSGPLLSTTITPLAPLHDPNRLRKFYSSSTTFDLLTNIWHMVIEHGKDVGMSKAESSAWVDVYMVYWKAVGEILATEGAYDKGWPKVYEAWKELAITIIRGYTNAGFQAWTVPCLYVTGRFLRLYAIKADEEISATGDAGTSHDFSEDVMGDVGKNDKLEDAARIINRIFTLCISDRAPLEESRKWGIYYTTNLLFKTYFKLNSIGLSKNILRALEASKTDMPNLESFPKSHVVTFKYYVGVISFLEEDYVKAEENLTYAWRMCHRDARRNRELVLSYLIPCHLFTTHMLPTTHLLAAYPRLQALFGPLSRHIKQGDLASLDEALVAGEDEFVKRRIYLTLEHARDIAVRNLLRKVYVAAGFEPAVDDKPLVRRSRLELKEFAVALCIGSKTDVQIDEVECVMGNMIVKNLIKGYISRERGIVILNKKGLVFPGTGL